LIRAAAILLATFLATSVFAEGGFVWPALRGPLQEFETVRRALRDRFWGVAETHADKALAAAEAPDARDAARLAKLEALARAGKTAEIVEHLDAWSDATGEGFRYWRAWACFRLGRPAEARSALAKAPFAETPWRLLAARLSARLAMKAGNREAAQKLLAEVSAATRDDPARHVENALDWAVMLAEADDAAAALSVLEKEGALAQQGAQGDAARDFAATLAERLGRTARAQALWKDLVAGGTNTEERLYVRAACALSRAAWSAGATNDAVKAATRAWERARMPETRRAAGFLLGFERLAVPLTRAEGAAAIRALVREFPGDEESRRAQLGLADALLAAGDAAGAEAEYRRYLDLQSGAAPDVRGLEGRGNALLALGRRIDAAAVFARAAQLADGTEARARFIFRQADALFAEGRLEEAAALYAQTAAAGGGLADHARFNRADALHRAGKTAEAEALWRGLADGTNRFATGSALRLAAAETARGAIESARAVYDRVLAKPDLAPDVKANALRGRGRAHYRALRFDAAAADFAAAARADPTRADEMDFLSALCLYGEGRDAEARAAAAALAAKTRKAALRDDVTLWLAKCDYARGAWEAAEKGFADFAARNPQDPRTCAAVVKAARCAAARGDWARAADSAARAVKGGATGPASVEALLFLAEALVELARFDEAALALERLAAAKPDEAVARRAAMLKADVRFMMGADDETRYADALARYRALAADTAHPVSLRVAAAYKAGRALEKLQRFPEMEDAWYTGVVQAYLAARAKGEWFDAEARGYFVRAAFALADLCEGRGDVRQAISILALVQASGLPAAEEARKRVNQLKEKGVLP